MRLGGQCFPVSYLSMCTANRRGYALHWHSMTRPSASAPRTTAARGSCLGGADVVDGSPFFQLVINCRSMRRPFSTSWGEVSCRIKFYGLCPKSFRNLIFFGWFQSDQTQSNLNFFGKKLRESREYVLPPFWEVHNESLETLEGKPSELLVHVHSQPAQQVNQLTWTHAFRNKSKNWIHPLVL